MRVRGHAAWPFAWFDPVVRRERRQNFHLGLCSFPRAVAEEAEEKIRQEAAAAEAAAGVGKLVVMEGKEGSVSWVGIMS